MGANSKMKFNNLSQLSRRADWTVLYHGENKLRLLVEAIA